ncbi:MAG: hypothetical protein O9309_01570 [Rhizobium sp.]|nr:hypothetical protein [Rhizobium sp.]MCZ8350673.1 hypothetical protein [Rhizobium sp.]
MMVPARLLTLACLFATLVITGAAAQQAGLAERFEAERALVEQLGRSDRPEDHRQLAELYRDGLIFSATNPVRKAERDLAILAYRRAMELGDRSPATIVALGRLLLRESGGVYFKTIAPDLQRLALEGSGEALYLLAADALENQKQPLAEVVPRLEAAALLGSLPAITDLSATGTPVGETLKSRLIGRLTERASSGNPSAALSLFRVYTDGLLAPADPVRAIDWLEQGANAGHLAAIEQLAQELLTGRYVTADPARAAALYRQAAEAGSRVAALELGSAAMSGSTLPVSHAEARTWLQQASEAGVRRAGVLLSNLDLKLALAFEGEAEEKSRLIEAALVPIATDPEALADLASQHWRSARSEEIAPVLLPMLEEQAMKGKSSAALALNAWLEANGQPLPDHVARALVDSLRKKPLLSVGFSNFTIANLALSNRISENILPRKQALQLIFKAADDNVGQAMLRLGQIYRHGDQLARSETFARRWFLRAQERAVERAFWELADMQAGAHDPQEQRDAESFYRSRMEEGDPRAALALADMLLRSGNLDTVTLKRITTITSAPADRIALASLLFATGLPERMKETESVLVGLDATDMTAEDLVALGRLKATMATDSRQSAAAVVLLEQAAASGTPFAKTALAATYLSSVAYHDKAEPAVAMLETILKDNPKDPEARLILARALMLGVGMERDAARAEALIAEVRRESGFQVPKATLLEADWLAFSASGRDPLGAETLLAAQAARGSAAAQRALGEYALNGFGPAILPDAAAGLMHQAAQAGDKEAMAALGHMLLNGYGVSQSRDRGLDWLSRAANAGNTAAMYELSRILALKQENAADSGQAIAWLRKAAERGHPNAAYQLGLAYLTGDRVDKDVDQAALWFERSAQSGNLLAARTLQAVRSGGGADALAAISNTAD